MLDKELTHLLPTFAVDYVHKGDTKLTYVTVYADLGLRFLEVHVVHRHCDEVLKGTVKLVRDGVTLIEGHVPPPMYRQLLDALIHKGVFFGEVIYKYLRRKLKRGAYMPLNSYEALHSLGVMPKPILENIYGLFHDATVARCNEWSFKLLEIDGTPCYAVGRSTLSLVPVTEILPAKRSFSLFDVDRFQEAYEEGLPEVFEDLSKHLIVQEITSGIKQGKQEILKCIYKEFTLTLYLRIAEDSEVVRGIQLTYGLVDRSIEGDREYNLLISELDLQPNIEDAALVESILIKSLIMSRRRFPLLREILKLGDYYNEQQI